MIRKLLMVAVAAAVPMSGLVAAGVAGTGTAGAKTPPPVVSNVTCSLGGTVNFANADNPGIPGISLAGNVTTNKDSTTLASTSISGCTGGTVTAAGSLAIVTKNTKCAPPYTTPAGCAKKLLVAEAGTGLASSSTTKSIEKAVKKDLGAGLIQGSNTFALKTKVTSVTDYEDNATGPCAGEVGFGIAGSFKTSPKSTGDNVVTLTVCLGADSGVTGPVPSVDNFFSDLTAGDTIATADIDASSSSVAIS